MSSINVGPMGSATDGEFSRSPKVAHLDSTWKLKYARLYRLKRRFPHIVQPLVRVV